MNNCKGKCIANIQAEAVMYGVEWFTIFFFFSLAFSSFVYFWLCGKFVGLGINCIQQSCSPVVVAYSLCLVERLHL